MSTQRRRLTRIEIASLIAAGTVVLVVGSLTYRAILARGSASNPSVFASGFIEAVQTADRPSSALLIASQRDKDFADISVPSVFLRHETTAERQFEDHGVRIYQRHTIVDITNQANERITAKYLFTAMWHPIQRTWRAIYFGDSDIEGRLQKRLHEDFMMTQEAALDYARGTRSQPLVPVDEMNAFLETHDHYHTGIALVRMGEPKKGYDEFRLASQTVNGQSLMSAERLRTFIEALHDYGLEVTR